MISDLRWRLLLYGILLLVPLAIGLQVYQGVSHLNEEIDDSRDLTIGGDDSVRLEVEYYRMRDGFERLVAGDPTMDFDEAFERFDIVWSRAAGIREAPDFHMFSRESGILQLATALLDVLKEIEPEVERLEPGAEATLADIRAALTVFEDDLAASSIGFAIRRQKRGVEMRDDLSMLVGNIQRMSFAVAVVFTSVFLMVALEALRARRAEFNVRKRERRARFLAQHDALTGLANRALLAQTMKDALDAMRSGGAGFHLLALDLDGFKSVNDTHGHQAGDELLKVIAERLTRVIRQSDMVARLGGDEFAVVLNCCPGNARAAEVAQRMIDTIEQPITISGGTVHLSTSIGIASAPADGDTDEAILRCADVALYEAKAAGRRTFRFFEADMDAMLRRRLHIEAGLRRAIEAAELDVHFQPQIDLASGHVFGVEALVRWNDQSLGPISPGVFIEIAAKSGLIVDLGAWVLECACRRVVAWSERGLKPQLAINLSPIQLHHHNFLAMLDDTLARTGLPMDQLTLEITEDAMVGDNVATTEILTSLRERRITLAVDDFGTGYSNLAYLKRLPIQYLKIDQTFVKDIETDSNDRAIINGIIGLARSLGLKTIAEGVETECQRDFLLAADCHMAQGFLFKPALAETELLTFLESFRNRRPTPGPTNHDRFLVS